ncbi:hypothetical protein AHiyo8_03040 [Arthrobacter sp. Hiyo8]|nr:hypothetical protein AHiyo8_03040 [Arthrobacter sp. Hiyo8]
MKTSDSHELASSEASFRLPAGGVDAIITALTTENSAGPAFVYERVDPFTREPLTTWIGIRVDERRLNNDAEQFSELRRELDGLKVEGAPGGCLHSSRTQLGAMSPILPQVPGPKLPQPFSYGLLITFTSTT